MSQQTSRTPIRFVHASDLHLERPLGGVSEVPGHLRELFLEAPYLAAQQVFETVLSEGADALLLAGDVVDVELAGPRAVLFLIEQFKRLADHHIPVYWSGGHTDQTTEWPAHARLPENVTRFPTAHVESISCQRDQEPIACIQGISRGPNRPLQDRSPEDGTLDDSQFRRDAHGLFTVGVSYGTDVATGTEGDRVHYMALGGRHRRQTVDQSPGLAHYCGTPQGRTPDESGPHGCTIVRVDESGHVKTRFAATDAVRWLTETIEITAGTDAAGLLDQILQRTGRLSEKHAGPELLISWRILGQGPLIYQLHPGGLADRLLEQVRQQQQQQGMKAWSVAIDCDAPLEVPAQWHDQETILGDLLRQIGQLETNPEIPLKLADFLPEALREIYGAESEHADGGLPETNPLAQLVTIENPLQRQTLLREAAKLGIDLITVEEPRS